MTVREMSQIDLAGKRVLIREDLNVPIKDGVVTSDARLRAALPSVRQALAQGGRVMLMSHLGRPTEGVPISEQPEMRSPSPAKRQRCWPTKVVRCALSRCHQQMFSCHRIKRTRRVSYHEAFGNALRLRRVIQTAGFVSSGSTVRSSVWSGLAPPDRSMMSMSRWALQRSVLQR